MGRRLQKTVLPIHNTGNAESSSLLLHRFGDLHPSGRNTLALSDNIRQPSPSLIQALLQRIIARLSRVANFRMGLRNGSLPLLLRPHQSPDPDQSKPEQPLAPRIPSITDLDSGQSLIHRNMPKARYNSNKSKTRLSTECQAGGEEGADSELLVSLLPLRRVLGTAATWVSPGHHRPVQTDCSEGFFWVGMPVACRGMTSASRA